MNKQEHLMTIAMEECNEVAQRISKAIRFGMEEVQDNDDGQNPDGLTNRQRIYEEYYDLRAVLGMIGIDAWDRSIRSEVVEQKKCTKVEKYLVYSESMGTLERGN